MPGYKATIIGENFEFLIDEEIQYLDFIRTVCVDASDEMKARESALTIVRDDLHTQSILDDSSNQIISLDIIQKIDKSFNKECHDDFIWSLAELDDFEYL